MISFLKAWVYTIPLQNKELISMSVSSDKKATSFPRLVWAEGNFEEAIVRTPGRESGGFLGKCS
jgi:hypothetical protein